MINKNIFFSFSFYLCKQLELRFVFFFFSLLFIDKKYIGTRKWKQKHKDFVT